MSGPAIQVQTSPGCGNADETLALVGEVIGAMVPGTAPDHVLVQDEAQARAMGFLGSPTVLVNGHDIAGAKPGLAGFT